MKRNAIRVLILAGGAAAVQAQQPSGLPSWLETYPGAAATVKNSGDMVESSYTAAKAQPDDVLAHYQKVFKTAKLEFQANPDGIGTTIRATAPECDLLIHLRERSEGTFVDVFCSAPSQAPAGTPVVIQSQPGKPLPARPNVTRTVAPAPVTPVPVTNAPQIPAELMERQKRLAAEMGIGRKHPDAPAPPLVWPSWLVNVDGSTLHAKAGVNYAKDDMLTARYVTNAPMTEIYDFYREALKSHEYPGAAELATGHTQTGVQQNALGYVEGSNYPDGAPGARSEIKVSFSRDVLNGPITVILTFTTHAYIASRGY